jgi:FkbM family methyltransferase
LKILKDIAIKALESHPFGYRVGVFILDNTDLFLPHEPDYHGFSLIASRGFSGEKLILDLGANRGHSARAFMKLLPGWRALSFEANPIHKARLEAIRDRSGGRFDFRIAAIGDRTGEELEIFTPRFGPIVLHSAASIFRDEALAGVEQSWPRLKGKFSVTSGTSTSLALDDLDLEPGFIKLDIQGGELAALRGMSRMLARARPVLLIELNLSHQGIAAFMAERGYKPYWYDHASGRFHAGESRQTRNLFYLPTDHERCVA